MARKHMLPSHSQKGDNDSKTRSERANINKNNLYTDLRGEYGTSGELYFAALADMDMVDDGDGQPDLQAKKHEEIDVHVEAKCSLGGEKVDVYADQMFRFLRQFGCYEEFVGKPMPIETSSVMGKWDESMFKDPLYLQKRENVPTAPFNRSQSPVFFNSLERITRIVTGTERKPYSTMAVEFTNSYTYPFEIGFSIYMAEFARKMAQRQDQPKAHITNALTQFHSYVAEVAQSDERKEDILKRVLGRDGWQNINRNLLEAIRLGSTQSLNRGPAMRETYEILKAQVDYLDGLESTSIAGPNDSQHHFLYYPHQSGAINQLITNIERNSPKLEELTRERRSRVGFMKKSPDFQIDGEDSAIFERKTGLNPNHLLGPYRQKIIFRPDGKISKYGVGRVPPVTHSYLGIKSRMAKLLETSIAWGNPREPQPLKFKRNYQQHEFDL